MTGVRASEIEGVQGPSSTLVTWAGEKAPNLERDTPGRESQLHHVLAVWPWPSFLAILSLGFIISKVQVRRVSTLESCCEDWTGCSVDSELQLHNSIIRVASET